MSYPRHQRARDFKKAVRTAGDLTTTSTSYADVSSLLDMTLAAEAGDVIEYGVNLLAQNTGGGNLVAFEVYTLVSAAVVNSFSGVADGSYRTQNITASNILLVAGSVMYTLLAGDLSAGTVTLRLRWKVNTGTGTLSADGTNRRAHVWAKNLGPQDPN